MSGMKIVVGLGNPGSKYEKTRHNLGFQIVDAFTHKCHFSPWDDSIKFKSVIAFSQEFKDKILLVKPQTFMNDTGEAVSRVVNFYKISLENLLVVHDDFDLPLKEIRWRLESKGKSTHNGIRSIVKSLKNPAFLRLRVGINSQAWLPKDEFVLQKFSKDEEKTVYKVISKACDKINEFIKGELDDKVCPKGVSDN